MIDGVAIGAMEPSHMLQRVGPGTLVIVPGDREDVILTLTTAHLAGRAGGRPRRPIARSRPSRRTSSIDGHEGAAIGLVLTGGYRPRDAVLDAIRQADLFATLVPEDTYAVASEVHDLLVKTHAGRPREDRADQGARRASTSTSTGSWGSRTAGPPEPVGRGSGARSRNRVRGAPGRSSTGERASR